MELYKNQKTEVTMEDTTKTAKVKKGVRQGCSLSPLLFNLYIEEAMCEIKECIPGVSFNGNQIHWVRFADDIAMVADTEEALQYNMQRMDEIFQKYNLKINIKKTKIMVTSKTQSPQVNIMINSERLEQVKSFTYLGSIIDEKGRSEKEIRARIAMAKRAFTTNRQVYNSKIHINIRKNLIKTYIWSTALYGCESWNITNQDRRRLEAFEMWCWRRMFKISWTEKRTNEEVLLKAREKRQIITAIEKRRAKCIGHILRHEGLNITVLEGKIEGSRGRGRPRVPYMAQVKEWSCSHSYQKVKTKAQDRPLWKMLQRQRARPS